MIYIASPYTNSDRRIMQQRYEAACRTTAKLLQEGACIFSPVVNSHYLTNYGLPTEWAFWEKVDRQYLEKCDVLLVLMLPGWQESVGVTAEIRIAKELGIPIEYMEPIDDEKNPADGRVARVGRSEKGEAA